MKFLFSGIDISLEALSLGAPKTSGAHAEPLASVRDYSEIVAFCVSGLRIACLANVVGLDGRAYRNPLTEVFGE